MRTRDLWHRKVQYACHIGVSCCRSCVVPHRHERVPYVHGRVQGRRRLCQHSRLIPLWMSTRNDSGLHRHAVHRCPLVESSYLTTIAVCNTLMFSHSLPFFGKYPAIDIHVHPLLPECHGSEIFTKMWEFFFQISYPYYCWRNYDVSCDNAIMYQIRRKDSTILQCDENRK